MSSDRPNRIIRIETPAFVHIYRVCSHGRSCFNVCKKLNSIEKKFLSSFYQNIMLAIKLNARFEFSDLSTISFYSARLRCAFDVWTRVTVLKVWSVIHRVTSDKIKKTNLLKRLLNLVPLLCLPCYSLRVY